MNSPTITRAKNFIKIGVAVVTLATIMPSTGAAEWKVDLSRRQKVVRERDARESTTERSAGEDKSFFDALFSSGEPTQELVILNTEKGFLPATVRLRKGGKYLVHVVNVNERDKNISFVLDGFSEHHSTFYGKVKSFRLEPKKEGVYSFNCPETSVEGRLVVYQTNGAELPTEIRAPAQAR